MDILYVTITKLDNEFVKLSWSETKNAELIDREKITNKKYLIDEMIELTEKVNKKNCACLFEVD